MAIRSRLVVVGTGTKSWPSLQSSAESLEYSHWIAIRRRRLRTEGLNGGAKRIRTSDLVLREFAKPGRELACRISHANRSTKPNHPNGSQRRTSNPAQIAPGQVSLWFGIRRPQPPTSREFAGFSGSILEPKREVSTPRAWVAVNGVGGELVSAD